MSDASVVTDVDSIAFVTGIATIQLNASLIVASFGSTLVAILYTLFVFTPAPARHRPVFLLNVLACFLGIMQAAVIIGNNYQVVSSPMLPLPVSDWLFKIAVLLIPPVVVDSVLVLRFTAFFPTQLTSCRTLFGVLAFPAIVKVARLVTIGVFIGRYPIERLRAPRSSAVTGLFWGRGPVIASVFGLQALDNAYASTVFLYKLYTFRQNGFLVNSLRDNNGERSLPESGVNVLQNEVMMKIPSIFFIALINYVVPVAMNITQTTLSLTHPHMIQGIYMIYCNNFITILGIVFATVWTTKQNWSLQFDLTMPPSASIPVMPSIQFQPRVLESGGTEFDKHDEVDFHPS